MNASRPDLTRTTLAVLAIVALIVAIFWVIRPFIGPAIWAATLVIASWPLMLRMQAVLGGRRPLAVAAMTLGLLGLLLVPLALGVSTVVQHADALADLTAQLLTMGPPAPPSWLAGLPVIGATLHASWASALTGESATWMARLEPYAAPVLAWLIAELQSIGLLLIQASIVVVLATVMYAKGEVAAGGLIAAARRLAGEQGVAAVRLAGLEVRSVALGVGITAVVQAVLGGIGLTVAGVPYASLLTVMMFVLAVAQLGALPVLVPTAGWMFWAGRPGWGIFLLVVGALASLLDTILRPTLIRMGADLPMLLILGGVMGGMLAFGPVGIFIGPVVLAVGYTLTTAWVRGDVKAAEAAAEARVADPPA